MKLNKVTIVMMVLGVVGSAFGQTEFIGNNRFDRGSSNKD